MKFSIVTNAYNQGRFLRRCMESVLRQSWDDLEYIVIDPGSTDETDSILREYEARGDRRLVIVRERDNGPADGLNKGFAISNGDWFGYLNADDFYLPGALSAVASAIAVQPDSDCIYGDGYLTDVNGVPTRRVHSTAISALKGVRGAVLVLQQSTFYRAESFRLVGGFNVDNRTSWDFEILIDMSLAQMKLVHVPGFWSAFAIHGDSITGSQRHAAESLRNHERIFQKVMGRPRTNMDLVLNKSIGVLDRALHPNRTFARIVDARWSSRLPRIANDLPPVERSTPI